MFIPPSGTHVCTPIVLPELQAHTILAALSYVKAYGDDVPTRTQGKTYNNLHIARVWCPIENYEANKEEMEAIVASLRLEEK